MWSWVIETQQEQLKNSFFGIGEFQAGLLGFRKKTTLQKTQLTEKSLGQGELHTCSYTKFSNFSIILTSSITSVDNDNLR